MQIPISQNLRELVNHRHLLFLWLKYRIEARYRQTFLGILWIALLPLSTALVLSFAFTQLLGAGNIMDVPFVAFILSGQVVFSIFQSIVIKSRSSILGSMGLIKQVYFPREILILLLVGEALVDFLFTFTATVVILTVFYDIPPNPYYILLPIPILIVAVLATGSALLVSWLSIMIYDMQQLIGILTQLLFFATVLYAPGRVSPEVSQIMALNPLASTMVAFRDIVLYGQVPDWRTLLMPCVLAICLLYLGYVIFKVNEDRFVDMA